MVIRLSREQTPIKHGWRSRIPGLGAAHGINPVVADLNLERYVRLLLAPAQRDHTLNEAIERLGLEVLDASAPDAIAFDVVTAPSHA